MKSHEFLVEYRREEVTKKFGDKLIQKILKDPRIDTLFKALYDKQNLLDNPEQEKLKILNLFMEKYIENYDTSKKYAAWLVREYVNNNIRFAEDISELNAYLARFDKAKNSRTFIDFVEYIRRLNPEIPDYATVKNVFNINATQFMKIMRHFKLPEPELKNKGDSTVVYEDATVRVIQPHDEAAACYYGQGTRWCTAATESDNYFEQYNAENPLYIILPKNPKYPGEKYQLHNGGSFQFMDQNDDEAATTVLDNYPGFKKWLSTRPEYSDLLFIMSNEKINAVANAVSDILKMFFKRYLLSGNEPYRSRFNDVIETIAVEKYGDSIPENYKEQILNDPELPIDQIEQKFLEKEIKKDLILKAINQIINTPERIGVTYADVQFARDQIAEYESEPGKPATVDDIPLYFKYHLEEWDNDANYDEDKYSDSRTILDQIIEDTRWFNIFPKNWTSQYDAYRKTLNRAAIKTEVDGIAVCHRG